MPRRKRVDPIPEEFESYEQAAAFWDSHDTRDYPEVFRTVRTQTELRHRHCEIEIEPDVVKALRVRARRKGVTTCHLASDLIRRQLAGSR